MKCIFKLSQIVFKEFPSGINLFKNMFRKKILIFYNSEALTKEVQCSNNLSLTQVYRFKLDYLKNFQTIRQISETLLY